VAVSQEVATRQPQRTKNCHVQTFCPTQQSSTTVSILRQELPVAILFSKISTVRSRSSDGEYNQSTYIPAVSSDGRHFQGFISKTYKLPTQTFRSIYSHYLWSREASMYVARILRLGYDAWGYFLTSHVVSKSELPWKLHGTIQD
jgi:hypothetical protein